MSNALKSEDLGFPTYMTFCAVVAAFSGFNVGWHISIPNMPEAIIMGVIEPDGSYHCTEGIKDGVLPGCLPMNFNTWGYTISAFAIGGFFGSIASKYTNVWYGRRINIMISCGWMIAGGILSACALNLTMYSVGRAFVGFASGLCGSSVAIYVSEIATRKSRGALGSLFELFLNFGILLTQVAGRSLANDWRYLWAIPTVLAALQMICLGMFCVETPRRLASCQHYDAACRSLQRLRADTDTELEFGRLLALPHHDSVSIWSLLSFRDPYLSGRTLIVMVIQSYNQMGGIGPMSVYSVGFFTKLFGSARVGSNLSLIDAAVNIPATVVALVWMHRVGRKGFMMISTGGMAIACGMMVAGSVKGMGSLAIAAAVTYMASYSMGCGVIPWMIAPELLPMQALASGSALGNASNWLFNFVVNIVWPPMSTGLGNYSFLVFVVINLIGFLFVWFFMPETTGKDLDGSDSKVKDLEDMSLSSDKERFDHIEVSN